MIIKLPFTRYDLRIERALLSSESNSSTTKSTILNRNYNKIFVIGLGKTGTTTMAKTLKLFGFSMGDQAVAEILSQDWALLRNSERIVKYCHTADAFQDLPFGLPDLYIELDKAFPNSKFILTVRDNPNQWYKSLTKFHTKKFSSDSHKVPDENDLANALYRYKGFLLDAKRLFWDYPNVPLYDEKVYKKKYIDHIKNVESYFNDRPSHLLKVNVAEDDDFFKLCCFLNVESDFKSFPWENKT